jgi:hypothetical protein
MGKGFWACVIGVLAASAIGAGFNYWLHNDWITILGMLLGFGIGGLFYKALP